MDPRVAVVGFVVGLLVGLTGMGGGAIMTPALILLGWAKPMVAVGTDLMWGTPRNPSARSFTSGRERLTSRLSNGWHSAAFLVPSPAWRFSLTCT